MRAIVYFKHFPSSRAHDRKFEEHRLSVHRDRVMHMKASVGDAISEDYWRLHESHKTKSQRSAVVEENSHIAQNNRKLNTRLAYIKSHKSRIGTNAVYIPASKRRNPFSEHRIITVRKICRENNRISKRLTEILGGRKHDGPVAVDAPNVDGSETSGLAKDLTSGEKIAMDDVAVSTSIASPSNASRSTSAEASTPSSAPAKSSAKQPDSDSLPKAKLGKRPNAAKARVHQGTSKVATVPAAANSHEQQQLRLKSTCKIYTNGMKDELDKYHRNKQEEKKHRLIVLNKSQKNKKNAQDGSKKSKRGAVADATLVAAAATSGITATATSASANASPAKVDEKPQRTSRKIDRITSAFAELTMGGVVDKTQGKNGTKRGA